VATLAFIGAFAKQLTKYNEKSGKTQYFSFFKNVTSFEPERMKKRQKVFWKNADDLRQWADGHGFDYNDFWTWGFQAFIELGFRHTFINTFKNMRLKLKILEYKKERDDNYIHRSDRPFFKAENFRKHWLQKQYYDYLIQYVLKRYPVRYLSVFQQLADNNEIDMDYVNRKLTANNDNTNETTDSKNKTEAKRKLKQQKLSKR
jgi:hypothetical protein